MEWVVSIKFASIRIADGSLCIIVTDTVFVWYILNIPLICLW